MTRKKNLMNAYRIPTCLLVAAMSLPFCVASCATVTPQRFQDHINYLASDELEGRGVGSKGIELAADYIAEQFEQSGLAPIGDNDGYAQTFSMTLHRALTGEGKLVFGTAGDALTQGEDYIPFHFSSDDSFAGPVVFCGYGITAPEKNRHDFVHLDLTGKVALMFRGEPSSWADDQGGATPHAMFRNKIYNAKDRGAVAVLIVNQAPTDREPDRLIDFINAGADGFGIPAFHVTRRVAETVLQSGGVDSLTALQQQLDDGGFASAPLAHVTAEGRAGLKRKSAPTRNVVGILRGHGDLAEEVVVVGAHYDHLGIRKPMMRTFKAGKLVRKQGGHEIHNGADDNASGVAGLIEIARTLANGPALKRSVLFVAFTGEEAGLHGSTYFVNHAPVDLGKIVAMLNMDMIGRLDADSKKLTVFGAYSAPGFMDMLKRAAGAVGVKIAPSKDSGGRSDHAVFVRHDIPSMHFFSGNHSDYHKPSDDVDLINSDGGARITTLVGRVAAELANQTARPTFQAEDAGDTTSVTSADTPTYRVVMGLAPGYVAEGEAGMLVEAVTSDGPADLAGMKAGDRIISIGPSTVANVYDYMAATRNNAPGDTVDVIVMRDGKKVTLKVTLSGAK